MCGCFVWIDRNVDLGTGIFSVGYLTLLVKKKERRGRRVSEADRIDASWFGLLNGYFGGHVLKRDL
jgi:hypothetical protein